MPSEVNLPIELVSAFTEMGPAWGRWVHTCLPDEAVSYARLRVLTALECQPDGQTMKQLATTLGVTPRRVTVLIDALEEDGQVERFAHPTDGRSTIVMITESGLEHQRLGWQQHQDKTAVPFADLTEQEQKDLLAISAKLTDSFRRHLALALTGAPDANDDQDDQIVVRNNRRMKVAPRA